MLNSFLEPASTRMPTNLFFLGLGLRQALDEIFHLLRLDHEIGGHLLLVRCYIPPRTSSMKLQKEKNVYHLQTRQVRRISRDYVA
jgi:hypothetical protein